MNKKHIQHTITIENNGEIAVESTIVISMKAFIAENKTGKKMGLTALIRDQKDIHERVVETMCREFNEDTLKTYHYDKTLSVIYDYEQKNDSPRREYTPTIIDLKCWISDQLKKVAK